MVSSLSLLFNRKMIFRLKNGFSRQLFLIPQSYKRRRNLHVASSVLQSEMGWFLLTLNPFFLSSIVFPIYVSFSSRVLHLKEHMTYLCEFPKLDHLTLWIFWFHLNSIDIHASLIIAFISSWFPNFLKIHMNLDDASSLYKFFGCLRDSMKFVSWYIDLRCSFLIFLNLFFTVTLRICCR